MLDGPRARRTPRFLRALLWIGLGLAIPPTGPALAQLGDVGDQFWTASNSGLGGPEEIGNYGHDVAAGDFDCDGFDDLATSAPGHAENAGVVVILYGSPTGPQLVGAQTWEQQDLGLDASTGDHFGMVLAAGDFDGDGCADLAIGTPHEDLIFPGVEQGAVAVIYGSAAGLSASGSDFFVQGEDGVSGAPEDFDHFGDSLAVGDLNHDGADDLAIGVPWEDIGTTTEAGAVHVLFGEVGEGLSGVGSVLFFRGQGLPGSPIQEERLGQDLAAGNYFPLLPGDHLAIGAPARFAAGRSGSVLLVLDVSDSQLVTTYSQASDGVPGASEEGDAFGSNLTAGDFNGDGVDELAVAVPGEDLENLSLDDAGSLVVLSFNGNPHLAWTQDGFGNNPAEADDQFPGTLAAADFDGDGVDDLAMGVYRESSGENTNQGILQILFGSGGVGLIATGTQTLVQSISPPETGDGFGVRLVPGRFSGHTGFDLAISAPQETLADLSGAGGVNVRMSIALFVDGFEGGNDSVWSD